MMLDKVLVNVYSFVFCVRLTDSGFWKCSKYNYITLYGEIFVVSYAKKIILIIGQDAWLLWDHLVPCLT